jgi:lipid-A-disaccharide synthase
MKIFIFAGEPSGDTLGAHVMEALFNAYGDQVHIEGVGGPKMEQKGLKSLFPMDEVALMGIGEILPKMYELNKRINQCVEAIKTFNPHIILTIDAPEFSFRLLKRTRNRLTQRFKQYHLVAPSVWAWRQGRAKKIKPFVDHLFCLFPFEPPYFDFPATFVGHPLMEEDMPLVDEDFLKKYHLDKEKKYLILLPGSRKGEVNALFPLFKQAAESLQNTRNLFPLLITLSKYHDYFKERFSGPIITSSADKWKAFTLGHLALAASGTVTLELMKAALPTVIGYKVDRATYWLLKKLIKTPYVGLPNILAKKDIMPECLQNKCRLEHILHAAQNTLNDHETIKNDLMHISQRLKTPLSSAEHMVKIIKEESKV